MRWNRRSDRNHVSVCADLRALGWEVHSVNLPGLDAIARKAGIGGRLVEIKDGDKPPSARKLTRMEALFQRLLPEVYRVITDASELS